MIRAQHRLTRIQLVNWGTFGHYHDLPVPRSGLVLTGPSGSGKSTVLDAMATLLVPPKWSSFNAAAQQSGRGDRARNVASYVRGAYRRDTDEASGQVAITYLRKDTTWSGVALTYTHDDGRVTTLGQLFHLQRGHVSAADVKHLYFLASESVDLLDLKPFAANGLEPRRLKDAFSGWKFAASYQGFASQLYRRFNLSGDQALRLLHKTQSSKNLNNLNTLLREFMLDEPGTFGLADQAIEQFAELSAAHATVVDARRQIETLSPLRTQVERHHTAAERLGQLAAQRTHLDRYLLDAKIDATETGLATMRTQRDALDAEDTRAREHVAAAQAHRDSCQRRLDGVTGDLATLTALIDQLRSQVSRAEVTRQRAETLATRAGLPLPQDAAEHAIWRTTLLRERAATDMTAVNQALHKSAGELHRARDEATSLEQELQVLERYRSNLGANLIRVQRMLADELRVDRDRLRFAGELIDVRPEAAAWQGAIERVLRPMAQTLLVPDDLYRPLAELVDSTGLGTRLVYARMLRTTTRELPEPTDRSLLHKISLVEGEQQAWLWERLRQQYDYDCVETAAELVGLVRAVTAAGQIKHGGNRHEKDDRSRVDDRSRWILGSSVETKKAALQALLATATERVRGAEAAAKRAQDHRDAARAREQALLELADISWTELDVVGAGQRLDAQEAELERRRSETVGLAEVERELAAATQALEAAHDVRQSYRSQLDRNADDIARAERQLQNWRAAAATTTTVPDQVRHQIATDWPIVDLPIEEIDALGRRAQARISDELLKQQGRRDRAGAEAHKVMSAYKVGWPARAADLRAEMDYAREFLGVLDVLEADGLPQHEDRFFALLQSQSRNNIGALSLKIKNSRREVRERIHPINLSLRRTEFAPGQHLEIEVIDRTLPAVSDFLRELTEITSESLDDLAEEAARRAAEARFSRMKGLLDRLSSKETADLQWRTQCLDTRQQVEFRAVVLDGDRQQTNVYEDSGGLSGGERQKLVTFCLAAALRYQLARDGAEEPEYALVILDEAFDKTDPEFTRAGLEVFREFGFQLLLATPLKMLQTLEDYVGGVAYVSNPDGEGSQLAVLPFDDEPAELEQPEPDRQELLL